MVGMERMHPELRIGNQMEIPNVRGMQRSRGRDENVHDGQLRREGMDELGKLVFLFGNVREPGDTGKKQVVSVR